MRAEKAQTKFQMVLPEELGMRLRAVATRKRVPLARLIRETMEKRIQELEDEQGVSPLFERLRGLGASVTETDLSGRVDEILYSPHPDASRPT